MSLLWGPWEHPPGVRVGWGANWGGKALDQCLAVMRESVVRLQGREKVPCLPEAPAPPWGPWSIVTPPYPSHCICVG